MPEKRVREAINDAIRLEMRKNPKVFLAGEDVALFGGAYGVTRGLMKEFTETRVKDTPISESAIIGLAVGSAAAGLRPIVEIMHIDFLGVCMDQLFNQAAKMRYMYGGKASIPMVLRMNTGAGFRAGAQHSQSLEAWLCHVPGLKVVMPSDSYDAKGLMLSAIRDNNPVVYLEDKKLYGRKGEVPDEDYTVPLGKAAIKREGKDVTIVSWAGVLHQAMAAATKLAEEGIQCEVVDPRTLQPLDTETIINSVKKTHRLVVAHEAVRFGGFGAEIAATVAEECFDFLDAPVKRIGAPFTPIPFSPALEDAYIPNRDKIAAVVKEVVS